MFVISLLLALLSSFFVKEDLRRQKDEKLRKEGKASNRATHDARHNPTNNNTKSLVSAGNNQ
jgi:hypothetical protein